MSASFPAAWYDLSYRLGSIHAVVKAMFDTLPCANIPPLLAGSIDNTAGLVGAADDLLDLARADLNRIEQQLKGFPPKQ